MNRVHLYPLFCLSLVVQNASYTTQTLPTVQKLRLRDCKGLDPASKKGCETIILTRKSIDNLDENAKTIKAKSSDAKQLLNDISTSETEQTSVKDKYNLTALEQRALELENKKTLLNSTTYGMAADEYNTINSTIQSIFEDPIVKEKVKTIIKTKQELSEYLKPRSQKIHDLGKVITQKVANQRLPRNSLLKNEILPLQQEIDKILLTKEIDDELTRIKNQITEKRDKLGKVLDSTLTSQEEQQLEDIKTQKMRKNIMLQFLDNPEKISNVTLDDLVGIGS